MLTASTTSPADPTQWVRLIPPGVTDPQARPTGSIGGLLAQTIRTIFSADQTALRAIDILCYRGLAHEEYLLRACPASDAGTSVLPIVASPDHETIYTTASEVDSVTAQFGWLLADQLIDRIGVEIVKCDPTPLGRMPALTTRLVTDSETPLSFERDGTHSHLATYLDDLLDRSVPHVARTIVAPASSDTYHVEQQVGHITPQARTLQRRDLARHSNENTGPSLAAQYNTDAVTSTWELLTDVGWDLDTPQSQSACHPTLRRQPRAGGAASTLYELCTHSLEYQRLLGTLGDPEPLADQYDSLAYSPTLAVEADTLSGMLGLVWGADTAVWDSHHGFDRRPPILQPLVLLRAPRGTDETAGHNRRVSLGDHSPTELWTPAAVTTDDWPLASPGVGKVGPARPTVTRRAIKRLREYGDSLLMNEVASVDTPWAIAIRQSPAGETSILVVDDGTVPPGELIAAASHGVDSHTITVVTDSHSAAERAAAILREPFVTAADTETVLYPRTARYWIESNRLGILPRDTPLEWTIDPTGRVRLYAAGACLASGTVWGEPLTPTTALADTTTPLRWVDPGSSLPVMTADGTVRDQYSSPAVLADEYRSVPLPAVPARRWWSPRATCLAIGPDGPSVADPLRQFRRTGESLEAAVDEFVDTYTCQTDETLAATTLATGCHQFLWPQTTTPVTPLELTETLSDLSRRTTGPAQFESALRKPDTLTLTRCGWIYPEATADRPAAPFADATTAGTPVASLADTLAVEVTHE